MFEIEPFFANASFEKVRALSPWLKECRPPSIYSPDGIWFYFSSIDEVCRCDDVDNLLACLEAIRNRYHSRFKDDIAQKFHSEIDFKEGCKILEVIYPIFFQESYDLLEENEDWLLLTKSMLETIG